MIGIIDYGMGNLASVRNALESLGAECRIVATPEALAEVDKAILPGVGAFGDAMRSLDGSGLSEAIREFALEWKRPFLGICLGMQLVLDESFEFGRHIGLGLVPGVVLPLDDYVGNLRVPNIGWCPTARVGRSLLTRGLEDRELCFYFVHSFFCRLEDRGKVTCVLHYGTECDVIVESDNVFACQFHPEKSQASGLKILSNFKEI
ncbi:MAG: imidazole glycerol phosphate synthase subunit HisH [Pseudodesulfovibrio sp.]